jgi:hypothetical protein
MISSDVVHDVIGQLEVEAIDHIEDQNHFKQQNGTSGGAHTSDIKQLLGLLKMREQGGSICFALLFPFTFLEAIKIIGNLLATAFRQGLHVFIIVEFGTATLVHVLQNISRVARVSAEFKIQKEALSWDIRVISI